MKSNESIDERSFEIVAGCFWDIVKTSSSYISIGLAIKYKHMYEPAVKQLNKGLDDNTVDDHQKFQLFSIKGQALLEIGHVTTSEAEKKQHLQEAYDILVQANNLFPEKTATGGAKEEIRFMKLGNSENSACAAALLGQSQLPFDRIVEALDPKAPITPEALAEVISGLKNSGQPSMVIDLLKTIGDKDIAWYLILENAEAAQEAAIRSDQGQYLLGLYNLAQKYIEPRTFEFAHDLEGFKARLQSNAAMFARRALGDIDAAKTLLRNMICYSKTPDWRVLECLNRLADILLEDFRLSKDPTVKKHALDETLKLLDTPPESLPAYYNPEESHLIVTVALMLRRLGPVPEYSKQMEKAFRNCIDELQDDTGINDFSALRRLARILGCVPGFERAAAISLTAQLYILDEDVRRKDLALREASEDSDADAPNDESEVVVKNVEHQVALEIEHDATETVASTDALITRDSATATSETPRISEIMSEKLANTQGDAKQGDSNTTASATNEIDEGLLGECCFFCNMCGKFVDDWSKGGAYLCLYCIDCDICEECFTKRTAMAKGKLEAGWQVVCPQGHRHIKAPVEGWRGVKDGVMRLGSEEIPFRVWLGKLEEQWARHWEEFWTDADMI